MLTTEYGDDWVIRDDATVVVVNCVVYGVFGEGR